MDGEGFIVFGEFLETCLEIMVMHVQYCQCHINQSQPQTVNSTNAKVRNANMNREVYQVATKTFQLNCRTVGYAYTDGECISCNLV